MNKYRVLLIVLLSFFAVHIVSAQPDIQVHGFQYPDQLKDYAQKCLSFLQVDRNIRVTIVMSICLAPNYEGQTIKTGADQFTIYMLARLKGPKQLLVLAHELIHVKQYITQKLEIRGDKIFWLGRRFVLKEESVFDPPWENEAYSADQKLTGIFDEGKKSEKINF